MHTRPLRLLLIIPLMLALPMRLNTTWAGQLPSADSDLPDLLDPKHTALIVHEMMNDFISQGGEYDRQGRSYSPRLMASVIPRIQSLLTAARRKNVRVIYVRFTSHEDGSTLSDANRRDLLSRREAPERLHIEGSWGWEIIDALKPQPQDLVLRKYRPDAFYGTILDSILRWNGIRTVITTGVGVAVGGVPTVMTAMNLGYQSIAVADAFISTDDKRTSAALDYLRAHAIVRSHREIVDAWDRSAPVLRRHGIKTLVLAGLNADDGGLQTLMRGWYIGYYRVVLTDGVLSNARAGEFGQGMLDMAMPITHEELIKIWTRP
jgi:ureidoacrylate peracid hydrolase